MKIRRAERRAQNRENYLRNRRRWCHVGPPIVMDDPTEEHAKALLMDWLSPREIVQQVNKAVLQVEPGGTLFDSVDRVITDPDLKNIWRTLVRAWHHP